LKEIRVLMKGKKNKLKLFEGEEPPRLFTEDAQNINDLNLETASSVAKLIVQYLLGGISNQKVEDETVKATLNLKEEIDESKPISTPSSKI